MAKPGRGRRSSPSGSLSGSSSRSRSPSRSRSISRSLSRSRSFSSSSSPSRSVSSRSRSPPPQRKKRMPESSDITRDDYKPLWKFVTKGEKKVRGGGNVLFTCNYCGNDYKGTYSRVKAHLLKLQGLGIGPCNKVSNKDIVDMKKLEDDACAKKIASMPKKVLMSPSTHASRIVSSSSSCSFNSFRVESLGIETKRRKGVEECPLEKAYNNHERDELRVHIARMFYSGGLPFHLARNPHYVSSFTYACTHNLSGFIPPGYNLLQNSLLQQEKARIERILQTIKTTWKDKGVTIVCDGWSDPQRRPFINFMAVTESDSIFIKAVNCEGEYKDKEFIANAILGVIREVGVENVVQVITDNAPVCKAAGVLIEVEYPHIFWTPCVVHTLNLALKNICNVKNKEGNEVAFNELGWIRKIADDAMMVKNFIMNHNMRLIIFNEFVPLKLLAIADTRFASIIIMLKRFKLVKNGLQSMVISDKWNLYREDDVGKAQFVKDKILNDVWWDKIDFILTFTSPIYDILRMGDTNKPSLHKIYEGWNSMIEQVKKAIFCHEGKLDSEESTFFNVVYDILVQKWTKSNTPLHCLAHSLTPRYYSQSWLNKASNRVPPHKDREITREGMKCLKRIFQDPDDLKKVYTEYVKFSTCYEDFAESDSIDQRGDMEPHFLWAIYGHSAPLLQSLAIKLVGQPSSSSCCERNWSTYSFIHSFGRNKLTSKRVQDLVFIHNNLRLLSRRSPQYMQGDTKMWDIGGDSFDDVSEDVGVLSIANLSLDEPELERVLFTDEGDEINSGDLKNIEEK